MFFSSLYQKLVISFLSTHGADVTRSGRSGDRGIDFSGHWNFPPFSILNARSNSISLPIIGQCKRLVRSGVSSRHLRDFSGVLTSSSLPLYLGVFATNGFFTDESQFFHRDRMGNVPTLLMVLTDDGILRSFVTNDAAKRILPPELSVGFTYGTSADERSGSDTSRSSSNPLSQQRLVILYNGVPIQK